MNIGGPAVIVAELMEGLNPALFWTHLVTGNCAADEADYLNDFEIDIKVTRIEGLGRSISVKDDLTAFFVLYKIIRDYKPDIIHTHTAKAGVLGRILGLFAYSSAKRVHTFHGHLIHGYFSRQKTSLIILTERILARVSHVLISIGNQVRDELLDVGIGKISQYEVVFPGLGNLQLQSRHTARLELGLAQNHLYLVFVGRLTKIKRPDRLIEIARHLKANHPQVQLLIAGAGENSLEIQEIAIQESLPMVFLGWRNDIGRIFSASDIAILCSDNEGIPLTLIQASQAGLPVVSTKVGSVGDIVVNGETGILTEVNSISLIRAIDELISDPEKAARFGQAGKKRAADLFSLNGMIRAHEDIYSQIIEEIN